MSSKADGSIQLFRSDLTRPVVLNIWWGGWFFFFFRSDGIKVAIGTMVSPAAREVRRAAGDGRPADGIPRATVLERSKHSDGTIYRGDEDWHVQYRIADRLLETSLEPMSLSDPTNCRPDRNNCKEHVPCAMMQIFSLALPYTTLAVGDGPVLVYGYLAVRDLLEPLWNVFHRSRDDPFVLDQGYLLQMTGPKRGIDMQSGVLLEFDMKIKKGEQESTADRWSFLLQ
ncbi:hypothetical protein U9M48_005573 [Paspalum notatum var. saurae]|uniref:DUF6598 domain-containing protein n=1 Tax=Paspalum notatum var. saurae TaxID=547442 RepID=A0AAQ3PXZ5_PASNO